MRLVGLALIGASLVASANAAPIVGDIGTHNNPNIVKAAGGCGFGLHPNRWGDCVPNRYGAYRMDRNYSAPAYPGGFPYSGGGYYRTYRDDSGGNSNNE